MRWDSVATVRRFVRADRRPVRDDQARRSGSPNPLKTYHTEIHHPSTSRLATGRPAIPSVLVVACWLVVSVFSLFGVAGCSDDHRRLSEGEALGYKRELIREGSLSPSQITEFGNDTRRTRSEIDSLYEKLSAESAAQRAKERAYWESDLRRELEPEPEPVEP